jgi:hypothetical protein
MTSKLLREICVINTVGQNLLKTAMEKLNLSARAYDRILKVSRTIADLSQSEEIKPEFLAEAIQYRNLDKRSDGWIEYLDDKYFMRLIFYKESLLKHIFHQLFDQWGLFQNNTWDIFLKGNYLFNFTRHYSLIS